MLTYFDVNLKEYSKLCGSRSWPLFGLITIKLFYYQTLKFFYYQNLILYQIYYQNLFDIKLGITDNMGGIIFFYSINLTKFYVKEFFKCFNIC